VLAIDIRTTAIMAMFSDDVLMEQLVLKGAGDWNSSSASGST